MSKQVRFFESGKTMLTAYLIAMILYLFAVLCLGFMLREGTEYIGSFTFAILIFFILNGVYQAYIRRELTSMNIMTGALIAMFMVSFLYTFSDAIATYIEGTSGALYMINTIIIFVLFALLLLNHVQIHSAHTSLKGRVLFNKVLLIILTAFQIYLLICVISTWSYNVLLVNVAVTLEIIAIIFIFGMIVCIESRLNAYKLEREASTAEGTWTAEKKEEAKDKYFGKKEEDDE